ncbi:MAG: transposase, partial [Saprospiraceae bacterium]
MRGKEKKPVEFGAKVHKLPIDGISIIEHLSFDAFNEGTRLKKPIFKAQQLTHRKVKLVGADAIYATNDNRKFLTKNDIKTDFRLKGRPSKHR